jgi:hypothetical protein
MGMSQAVAPALSNPDFKKIVLDRYADSIAYYWKMSRYNKRSYKLTRYLMIVLGALVTLVSSLYSADFIKGGWKVGFAVLTPLLAASLAIVGGVSQSFQWGAAWSDMVITAARMEKERDRISVTAPEQIDPVRELALLDDLVINETQGFFQRLFGSGGPAKAESKSGTSQPG